MSKTSKIVNQIAIGLSVGIMLSASIWSLLVSSVELSQDFPVQFLPVTLGFLLGCLFMILLDLISTKFAKKRLNFQENHSKAYKIFTAITIHNIPEGLAVGFAIGSALLTDSLLPAVFFTLGIALQNFPEGLATALPIYNCIKNRKKACFMGFLSGIVEPIFAVIGLLLASQIAFLQPWFLAFAAGSMIFVIIEELIPEIHEEKKHLVGTISFVIGFCLMTILDTVL